MNPFHSHNNTGALFDLLFTEVLPCKSALSASLSCCLHWPIPQAPWGPVTMTSSNAPAAWQLLVCYYAFSDGFKIEKKIWCTFFNQPVLMNQRDRQHLIWLSKKSVSTNFYIAMTMRKFNPTQVERKSFSWLHWCRRATSALILGKRIHRNIFIMS